MNALLVILLIAAVVATVISLVRGVVAFMQSTKLDLESPDDADRAGRMQLKQNKMMMNRIKFQALAIVIVVILLAINN